MARILLAEDDPDLNDLVTFKLEQAGFEVTSVATGPDVLHAVEAGVPDLFLLDVTLPEMTGLEVCAALRRAEATRDSPVVLLTGLGRQTDIAAGLSSGADDYLLKPFSPNVLIERVNQLLTDHGGG
ncbi:response regulator transcription factor [Actinokineospora enzanensis]|uniref:response regulator transcription factor n=1 Tax=Actinokineospora enzanensis TaxID=155975 RepID=UPI0003796CA5|nr:response regulator [Actinokineospora enzanensis]